LYYEATEDLAVPRSHGTRETTISRSPPREPPVDPGGFKAGSPLITNDYC
jgi:hypothetical protein